MSWMEAKNRSSGKSCIRYTSDPVSTVCVVSDTTPFGFGFPNDVVNETAKEALKKITSDDDGFTWPLSWWKVCCQPRACARARSLALAATLGQQL